MARPGWTPTDAQRRQAETMAAYGIPEANIARVLGVSKPTLRKHCGTELDTGATRANSKVADVLFYGICGGTGKPAFKDERARVTAAIFSADARDVMVEGESGLLAIGPPQQRPQWRPLRCEGCGLLVFWTAISDRAIVDQNERRTRHAGQPARHDHLSRTVLSGQHQNWCSGRRVRSPPYRNERVARPELRLQWAGQ